MFRGEESIGFGCGLRLIDPHLLSSSIIFYHLLSSSIIFYLESRNWSHLVTVVPIMDDQQKQQHVQHSPVCCKAWKDDCGLVHGREDEFMQIFRIPLQNGAKSYWPCHSLQYTICCLRSLFAPVKVRSWRRSLLKVVTQRQRSWNEVDCPCVWNNKENSNTIPTTHQILIGFFNYKQSILGYPHLCRTPSPCILRCDFPQEEVQCLLVAASCREGKDSQKADRATV